VVIAALRGSSPREVGAACGTGYPALNAPATAEQVWSAIRRLRDGD